MIKVNNVIKEMETLAPICLKEDFDNVKSTNSYF